MRYSDGAFPKTAVSPAGWRASNGLVSRRAPGTARRLAGKLTKGILIALLSGCLIWIVSLYGSGLRDPRYFDGWVLAGGMALQLSYHIAVKTGRLPPKSILRWRTLHILLGYVFIAAFVSHSDFSLPETGFEWALWLGFVLVALSGVFGTYLAWALPAKHGIDQSISYERIPSLRAGLATELLAVIERDDSAHTANALPAPPSRGWISELYTGHLKAFFEGHRNYLAHLAGSQRPLKRLTDEIDTLSRFADTQAQAKLAEIRDLVIEKDRLDFARVYLGLTRGCMLVHVPVTYSLIVLTVLHVIVVYAYSSGFW